MTERYVLLGLCGLLKSSSGTTGAHILTACPWSSPRGNWGSLLLTWPMISCVSRLDTKLRRSSEAAYRRPAGWTPSSGGHLKRPETPSRLPFHLVFLYLHIICPAFLLTLEYSLEGLMLKLKFQYLGHLMRRADSLEKTLMPGNIEG